MILAHNYMYSRNLFSCNDWNQASPRHRGSNSGYHTRLEAAYPSNSASTEASKQEIQVPLLWEKTDKQYREGKYYAYTVKPRLIPTRWSVSQIWEKSGLYISDHRPSYLLLWYSCRRPDRQCYHITSSQYHLIILSSKSSKQSTSSVCHLQNV